MNGNGANTGSAAPVVCLSIRQPWAWLIAHGWKNIENRTWPTGFRGRFLIHAAKGMTRAEYDACMIFTAGFTCVQLPRPEELERGGIVGEAVLLDCVRGHPSEWFCGPWGFVLGDARPKPFYPARGALGFFRLNFDARRQPFKIVILAEPKRTEKRGSEPKPTRCYSSCFVR